MSIMKETADMQAATSGRNIQQDDKREQQTQSLRDDGQATYGHPQPLGRYHRREDTGNVQVRNAHSALY